MSTLRRLATMTAAVTGTLLATLALTATPAHAADAIQVDLSGVSGNMNAGSRIPSTITGTYTNKSDNAITNIRATFTIQLDGLTPEGVRIQRLDAFGADLAAEAAGDGTVRIVDPLSFDMGKNNRRQTRYLLQFTSTAPTGQASIMLELYSGATRLGGDSASTNVRGGAAPTKTTPPNTNPGIVPTFEAGPSLSIAPLPESADLASDAGDVPASLYVMGGLLVALGGVILFLLFRRQRPEAALVEYPVTEYEQVQPPSLGYPKAAGRHPTAVLPTVRDSEPPTDPWRRRP
jgi:hypothetical protein